MKISYMITKDNLYVSFDGKYHTVNSGNDKYSKVLALIKENKTQEIPKLFEVQKIHPRLDEIEGQLSIDGEPLPESIKQRVMEFQEQNLPFDYLLNFWDNLKQNPSFRAREQLFTFLEQNGHPITEDGCFIAYRGVTEDFKDKHTRTFDNSPGSVCEMPREMVDDDPTRTCSAGLHVAAWDYASGFGPVKVEVKINPKDVVSVPIDYNGQKMRVCRFEVLKQCQNMISDETVYGKKKVESNKHNEYAMEEAIMDSYYFDFEDEDDVLSIVEGIYDELLEEFPSITKYKIIETLDKNGIAV